MLHILEKKRTSPEVERLEKLLLRVERKWRMSFREFIASTTSDAMIRRVANLVESGKIDDALSLIDSFVIRLAASVIPPSFTLVGTAKIEAMAKKLSRIAPLVAASFDPAYPRAAAIQQRQTLEFVTQFTAEQRTTTSAVISEALQSGAGTRSLAREIKGSMGLTDKQWKAVRNYRRLLEEGSLEALSRDIRDRRFDSTVQSTFEAGNSLSKEQIDNMVARYTSRYHDFRAESIATTEAGRTLSEANREAFQQVTETVGIPDDRIIRTWNSSGDERTRESHKTMDQQKVTGMNTPYVTGAGNHLMYPCDPNGVPGEVIRCRCVETQELTGWADA